MELRRAGISIGALALVSLGCGAGAARPIVAVIPVDVAPAPEEQSSEPDTLMESAAIAVHGRAGALIHVARLRPYSFVSILTRLGGWDMMLAGAGLDPLADVDTVYVSDSDIHACSTALVLRHHLSAERIHLALGDLLARSDVPRKRFFGLGFEAVEVNVGDIRRIVAAPLPDHLVVLPVTAAHHLQSFRRGKGLPAPKGEEALVFETQDPYTALRGPRGPLMPDTLQSVRITFLFDSSGARVLFDAWTTWPEQAIAGAADLTRTSRSALGVSLIGLRIQLFDAFVFAADGDRVKADIRLSADEIAWIFAMGIGAC